MLPDVDAVCCLRNALVCAPAQDVTPTPIPSVGSTIFVPGRSSLVGRPIPCSRTVKGRRSDFAGRPSTPLTALRVHGLMLFSRQQPNASTLSHRLERLRRAASLCHLSVLLVSRFVLAACARAERCREHPRSGSSVRCSGTDFGDLPSSPQIYPEGNRHCFEVTRPIANFSTREISFPACRSRSFTPWVPQDPRL